MRTQVVVWVDADDGRARSRRRARAVVQTLEHLAEVRPAGCPAAVRGAPRGSRVILRMRARFHSIPLALRRLGACTGDLDIQCLQAFLAARVRAVRAAGGAYGVLQRHREGGMRSSGRLARPDLEMP